MHRERIVSCRSALRWLWIVTLFAGTSVQSAPLGHLVHRYSFTPDASDSVGPAHGELVGGAAISGNAVMLDGSSGYVNLPNNLCTGLTSVTFEAWAIDSGSATWARLLDFGNSNGGEDAQGGGTSYIFLAWPGSGGNTIRACFREPGQAEVYIQYSPKPAIGVAHHVVWTQDANSSTSSLYIDGVLLTTSTAFTPTPASVGATVNNWLGRSQYNDPYFLGSIDEFRIYDFALPPEEVARNYALGPDAAPLGPVGFLAQPPSLVTVGEGRPLVITTDVTGAPPFQFQWYRNGTAVPGATNMVYSAAALITDHNATFTLRVTNYFTNTTYSAASSNVLVQVDSDVTPPGLLSATSISTNGVAVTFTEAVRPDSATNPANYSLIGPTGPVILSNFTLSSTGQVVSFTARPLLAGSNYVLTVSHVQDLSASSNTMPAGTQIAFVVTPFEVRNIGSPAVGGLLAYTNTNQLVLSGGGKGIGGTADECSMTISSVTGDFDRQVRLAGYLCPVALGRAGLMARETLNPDSPFAATLASSGLMGCSFLSRASVQSTAAASGQFPVNYPHTWLRLRRAGDLFTGFASYDGLRWTVLGSASLSLSNTLQVGIAVASSSSSDVAKVTFQDFGTTASTLEGGVTSPGEPLGPSSRRTQLVISEIMYKPADRVDGRNTEFVEIFNANPWPHDMSNHRLAGDLAYTFPAHTVIPGGGFLVVAAAPADLQEVYGLSGVLGPYENSLKTSGTVRLYDEADMLLLEVEYADSAPWPVGADGTGHSIVLARPSRGEADPRAWDRSDLPGGSPGGLESFQPDSLRNVVINEVLAHTDLPDLDTIGLYNHSTSNVDLSGCVLSDDPLLAKFQIPTNTIIPARGFVWFTEAQLGFNLNSGGETIYFKSRTASRVIDAVKFDGQENGVSIGRSPDGGSDWYRLSAKTFGTNNAARRTDSVVINEIMYHPISGSTDDQYVELHNTGATAVNLGGWRFVSGINFTFPSNTVMAPKAHLVLAANAARLLTNYTQLNATNLLGNFGGRLSGRGERLALARPDTVVTTNTSGFPVTNTIDIVVEEVTYGTGGAWGHWSDGGGSSLELTDSRADRRLAANWADSDESSKAAWTNIETTGTLDHGSSYASSAIGYAQIGLMDAGECLVDNLEVVPSSSGLNYVANPNFSAGLDNWSLQGAFSRSSLQSTQGYGGSGAALQLRTANRLFTLANSAQCVLNNTSLGSGQVATMRFKGRWLRGTPDIVFRLNGNWLEAAGSLAVPRNLGSPGLRNSRAVTNAAPALHGVTHTPALPAAGDTVVVTAMVHDPDGLSNISVFYRVDPAVSYSTVTMRDDGSSGDLVARDGIYSATLPAVSAGTTIAFYVQATDAAGAVARFPAVLNNNGPLRECVVRYGDSEPPGAFGIYHLWLTQTNVSRWMSLPIMSNEEIDATLVYRGRVIYNASARYAGSPYHEAVDGPAGARACHYIWSIPKDDLFLGTSAFNKIHWPGNDIQDDTLYSNNNDSTLQREQTANTLLRGLGVPWISRRYVVVYVNGVRRGQVMEDALRPSGSVPDAYFPDDTAGSLFKIQPWFEGAALPNASGYLNWENKGWASVMPYKTTTGGYKTARYRWHYEPRGVPFSANDYTNVFTLLDAFNSYNNTNYTRILKGVIDVDQWTRLLAANHAAGNWDCFGIQNGQNVYGYVSPERRWQLFMFDFNIVLGNRISWAPGANLEKTQDTAWEKFYGLTGQPEFRRLYWRALKELVNGPMLSSQCDPLLDAKYSAFIASGINAANPGTLKNWIASARTSIANQVASHDAPGFSVQGSTFTTSSNLVSLSGIAPLEVDSFQLAGLSCSVKWTSTIAWTLLAPVPPGTNILTLVGLDRNGNPVSGASRTVTVINTAVPESPERNVLFSEILYHPAQPEGSFVELYNSATNTPFDLGGWQVNGLSYFFPTGTVLMPREFLVLARSRSTFANTYGVSNLVSGTFDGTLQQDGETLSLLQPGTASQTVIDRVRYETNAPWPGSAVQPGASLQLRDLAQDNSRVANWTAVTNAAPPEWVYATATGTATSSRVYVYLDVVGSIYLDDVKLVSGLVPDQGANLLANGGFETALTGTWNLAGDLASSVRDTSFKRTGTASLRLVATGNGGSGAGDTVYQDIAPALTNGQAYTVSYWYRPATSANGGKLIVRLQNSTATVGLYSAVGTAPAPTVQLALASPGATNSVATTLPPFPTLWLNEVQPQNVSGPLDNFNQRDPWLELYNNGTVTQSLAGLYLGTNYATPQWAFPAAATIAPGQFLLIWADGQPGQTTGSVFHTSFRLSGPDGSLVLSRYVSNALQVVDYLNFSSLPANYSYGDVPDGQPFYRQPLPRVSPGSTNNPALLPITVYINEWMAENTGFITDPGTGAYDDWFEIYNPTDTAAELGGYFLSDNLADPLQFEIPAGYRVPPHGFLLVWADSKSSANSSNSPDLHVNFKLSKDGEAIGLFAPDSTPIDYVVFGAQSPNISEGRYPDAGSLSLFMPDPSPGAPNLLPPDNHPPTVSEIVLGAGGTISLSFPTAPGHSYQVEFKDNLNAPTWLALGTPSFATGNQLTVTDPSPNSAHRFYRVRRLD